MRIKDLVGSYEDEQPMFQIAIRSVLLAHPEIDENAELAASTISVTRYGDEGDPEPISAFITIELTFRSGNVLSESMPIDPSLFPPRPKNDDKN